MKCFIVGFTLLTSAATASAGSVLLASSTQAQTGSVAPQVEPRVQFVLQLSDSVPLPLVPENGLGVGVWWEEGTQGFVDFTLQSDVAFGSFANDATDGEDARFAWITGFFEGNDHGLIGPESELLDHAPDLIGFQLDRVRLIVDEVHFEPFAIEAYQGYSVDAVVRYEFYGTSIPEPCTFLLLGIGLALLRRVSRRGRSIASIGV